MHQNVLTLDVHHSGVSLRLKRLNVGIINELAATWLTIDGIHRNPYLVVLLGQFHADDQIDLVIFDEIGWDCHYCFPKLHVESAIFDKASFCLAPDVELQLVSGRAYSR